MEKETPDFYVEKDIFGLEKPHFNNEEFEDSKEKKRKKKLNVTYASLGIRIIAYCLDIIILSLPTLFIYFIILGENFNSSENNTYRLLINIVILSLYYAYLESSDLQGTLGKKICGIKVIDIDGKTISFKIAFLRYITQIISIFPLGFGIWAIASNEHNQAWHDAFFDCYVVKNK